MFTIHDANTLMGIKMSRFYDILIPKPLKPRCNRQKDLDRGLIPAFFFVIVPGKD